jgi:hypothetical protein
VRRTCAGGGHASGTARLWYNGQGIDSGATRDAGSRFGATVDDITANYYLRSGLALSTAAGTSQTSIDRFVDSKVACPGRPFSAFGTWSISPPLRRGLRAASAPSAGRASAIVVP